MEQQSIFALTLSLASSTVKPALDIVYEVTNYYSTRLYQSMLQRRNQRRYYKILMDKASSYEQWAAAGFMLDRLEGNDKWKRQEKTADYDYELTKERLNILKTIRKNGDIKAMIFNLKTSLCRNLGGMGNPKLYLHSNVGTKEIIELYIEEVVKQMNFICDVGIKEFLAHEKLEMLKNIQKGFGRTALLLSGGGTFGLAHAGPIKTLYEQKLLPKIITGSSAGSIVAAIIGTSTDSEMIKVLHPSNLDLAFFGDPKEPILSSTFKKIKRIFQKGVLMDEQVFHQALMNNLGDITFAEAYNRTGRILNITVSSSTNYEMPRLLNYLTSPNVLIRSAVAASSAVPFVFESAPLLAKDSQKNIVRWNPSGHLWIDGSVEGDLPMQRISELFGVNHYCVSQTNPHIIPFLNVSGTRPSIVYKTAKYLGSVFTHEFSHRLTQVLELGLHSWMFFKMQAVLCQKYVGDITIVPHFPWSEFFHILSPPDEAMFTRYQLRGERATWTNIALFRNHCTIEQCINQNIMSLRKYIVLHPQILKPVKMKPDRITFQTLIVPTSEESDDLTSSPPLRPFVHRHSVHFEPSFQREQSMKLLQEASMNLMMQKEESIAAIKREDSGFPFRKEGSIIVTERKSSLDTLVGPSLKRAAKSQGDVRSDQESPKPHIIQLQSTSRASGPVFYMDLTYKNSDEDIDSDE